MGSDLIFSARDSIFSIEKYLESKEVAFFDTTPISVGEIKLILSQFDYDKLSAEEKQYIKDIIFSHCRASLLCSGSVVTGSE